jgi:hypothetical protein
VNLTAKSDDPRKYNPRYQHESSRKLVSEKYINPIGAKRALAEKGMATVLEEASLNGRSVPLERLQSDWKRFNALIIDGVTVDFDSFGPITHVITSDSIVLLRFTAQQAKDHIRRFAEEGCKPTILSLSTEDQMTWMQI